MYAREIEGETFTFGVSGKLYMNALVMYDHQTDSLWSQFTGDAVAGPKKGAKLEILPALQTLWESWLLLHPDTLALDKGGRPGYDPYVQYYLSNMPGIFGETVTDDRLGTKDFVAGVVVQGQPRAYSVDLLYDMPVVNDSVNGVPLVVVFDSVSASTAVYERETNGQVLTFSLVEQEEGEWPPKIRDEETGTVWSVLRGSGIEGPLAGTFLRQVPSHYSFWFAWSDFHPDTEVYGQ